MSRDFKDFCWMYLLPAIFLLAGGVVGYYLGIDDCAVGIASIKVF